MNNFMNVNSNNQFGPSIGASIPYKPVTFERLSNVIGMTYNLSSIENINTVSLPRGNEQQIFFVNNDDKIYVRAFDNTIGIVGYKQDYVEKLQNELNEAQSQLHEIFDSVSQNLTSSNENSNSLEDRVTELERKLNELNLIKEEKTNGNSETTKTMAAISDMA